LWYGINGDMVTEMESLYMSHLERQ